MPMKISWRMQKNKKHSFNNRKERKKVKLKRKKFLQDLNYYRSKKHKDKNNFRSNVENWLRCELAKNFTNNGKKDKKREIVCKCKKKWP
jgi:hypothetical protein